MADYFLAVCTDAERNSSRSLNVASHIYNYRLTRARRILLRPFGMVCNKWRIFRCAIDVSSSDFCDVIVKTCCILHNFVHQRDGFQFQGTLYECLLESVKAVNNQCNITGTGMSLHWGACQWASLPGTYV